MRFSLAAVHYPEQTFSRTRLVVGDLAHARTCAGAGTAGHGRAKVHPAIHLHRTIPPPRIPVPSLPPRLRCRRCRTTCSKKTRRLHGPAGSIPNGHDQTETAPPAAVAVRKDAVQGEKRMLAVFDQEGDADRPWSKASIEVTGHSSILIGAPMPLARSPSPRSGAVPPGARRISS